MEVVLLATLVSFFVSVIIGNIVGVYYLKKLDRDWENVFKKIRNITTEEIKKYMHR